MPHTQTKKNSHSVKGERAMNRIKEILKVQGRSQAWLSTQIDKSYAVVTNYCNNNTQPSIEVLRKIAKALDVDIRELLVPTKHGD